MLMRRLLQRIYRVAPAQAGAQCKATLCWLPMFNILEKIYSSIS